MPSPLDEFSRKGKGEFHGVAEYLTGWETTKFNGGDISLKIDSGFAGGIGFGYSINDYLNVNSSITGGSLDFEAEDSFFGNTSDDTSVVKWDVNLDYNILKKRLTPLITTGVGMTYFSGNFANQWFDFGEADLVWGIGGGVRWDISDRWFVKTLYRVNWTSLEKADNATRFNSIALGIGYVF
jgi:opacity protein-like surface antigen